MFIEHPPRASPGSGGGPYSHAAHILVEKGAMDNRWACHSYVEWRAGAGMLWAPGTQAERLRKEGATETGLRGSGRVFKERKGFQTQGPGDLEAAQMARAAVGV